MKTITAIAAILGALTFSASQSGAEAHIYKHGKKHAHYAPSMKPQVRGYIARGYAYEYEYQRNPYQGIYGGLNYPTDFTIWERVNSDPRNSNALGVSGL
jgi:hypothetical protein